MSSVRLASVIENARLTPVRRSNLALLTAYDGATARLASVLRTKSGPVSAMKLRLDKSIGRRVCSKIEAALSLPELWMDTPHSATDVPDLVSLILNNCARGSKTRRTQIDMQIGAMRTHVKSEGAVTASSDKRKAALSQQEVSTIECLTYLRSASASMSSALQSKANLPNDIWEQLVAMDRKLNGLVGEVWNTVSRDE